MGLEVINKSSHRVSMTKVGIFYDFDYGVIPLDSSGQIFLDLQDDTGDIKNLRVESTCGCTTSTMKKQDNIYTVSIIYDTKRVGDFIKQLKVFYKENTVSKKLIFNIKGKVK